MAPEFRAEGVNAGPGSGKTKVLTERIAWLVQEQGVPPGNILAMTFSVKAAKEMRVRNNLLLRKSGEDVKIGTQDLPGHSH